MNEIILYCMAFGALIGGIDHILGNRFGYGARFEEAFRLLGSIGLSMAGIICLAPLMSAGLGKIVVPLFRLFGFDPGMFGSILAIDMGGYQMAMDLAADPQIGRFAGIIVSAIFGCTIVFTIPVGMGALGEADRPYFIKGILLGLSSMPIGILAGGLVCGLTLKALLWHCLPVFLVSAGLFAGLLKQPEGMTRGFRKFAAGIQKLSIFGLMAGAIQYMTGRTLLPGMIPLEEAMEVVCSIAIVMLGSMPLAQLLQLLLKRPFCWIGRYTGLNQDSTTGILIGAVSVVPALAMVPRMDNRGKVVIGAFVVCGASTFAAHLGFVLSTEPQLATALVTAKLLGGLAGIVIALVVTKKQPQM
jgi:ethanolamine transporter